MAHVPHPSRVRYGPGAIEQLPAVVSAAGAERTLLVCGGTSLEASGADRVVPGLRQVTGLVRWSDFSPNPDTSDLASGLEVLHDVDPDMVVGLGGGSSMDMAKLLCAFAGTTPSELAGAVPSVGPISGRRHGLVLAPATSGSGSEATHFAVVYIGEEKYSIAGPALYPDTVLLDPDLGRTAPRYQRGTSGIDAVCQSIESLWATSATARSRRLARHALGLLLPSIETFVAMPDDHSARAMCLGSHLAGRAIDISKTTAAHALSYGITKRYGVSHGNAVALTLGQFIEAHADVSDDQLQAGVDPGQHREALATVLQRLGASTGAEGRQRFDGLLDRIGLRASLQDVPGANEGDLASLAAGANLERLGNNPMVLDLAALTHLLHRAYGAT